MAIKYTLTLTAEADSPEELLKFLDFKKRDLYPLEISLDQISHTLEHAASLPGVTLAGKAGPVRYVVAAARTKSDPKYFESTTCVTAFPMPTGMEVRLKDDRPEGCHAGADGTGHCGGPDKCDQTGVCAKGATGD